MSCGPRSRWRKPRRSKPTEAQHSSPKPAEAQHSSPKPAEARRSNPRRPKPKPRWSKPKPRQPTTRRSRCSELLCPRGAARARRRRSTRSLRVLRGRCPKRRPPQHRRRRRPRGTMRATRRRWPPRGQKPPPSWAFAARRASPSFGTRRSAGGCEATAPARDSLRRSPSARCRCARPSRSPRCAPCRASRGFTTCVPHAWPPRRSGHASSWAPLCSPSTSARAPART